MGVGFSDYMENNILHWLFKQVAVPVAPTGLHYALHSADPGDDGSNELTATGSYARAPLAPDINAATNTNYNAKVAGAPATAQKITNLLDISFPQATADWNGAAAIQFFSCFDAATVGNALFTGAIGGGGVVVLNGNTLKFTGGSPGTMSMQVD